MCSAAQTCIDTCGYSWEDRKVWAGLLLFLRKCTLDYGKRCRGKIWVPGSHVSRVCYTLLWLFQLRFLFCFRPEGKQKLLSPAVVLRHWLCNKTWLQQIQKHFFAELCIWTWTQDDPLWLCSFWTNYTALWDVTAQGVSAPESSVMATMCNRDLNTLKCQGRWGFWVLVCQLLWWKPYWAQLIYYTICFSVFPFVRVMYILKLIRGKCQLYTSNNILCSKLNPKGRAKDTKSPTEDCSR